VVVVDALAYERDRGLCVIRVGCWHVEIVHEVEQGNVAASQGLEGLTLFLEHAFELQLQADAVGLEVEVDRLGGILRFGQFLQHTVDQL
jgi:hypothetical protein